MSVFIFILAVLFCATTCMPFLLKELMSSDIKQSGSLLSSLRNYPSFELLNFTALRISHKNKYQTLLSDKHKSIFGEAP